MDAWVLDALAELVGLESPSAHSDATQRAGELFASVVQERVDELQPERIVVDGRTHLRWTWGEPTVLLLGHVDTVWPLGTTDRWPFALDGDRASGPGVFDMKCGLVQAALALSTLDTLDGVRLLVTSDEELGSPTSADLVRDSARGLRAALVCEPAAGGALKTARKGIAQYEVRATGRAAHAGLEPEKGANAGVALAHALLAVAELGDPSLGTTVTPTRLGAGTTTNTVPAEGTFAVDVRSTEHAELVRVERAITAALDDAAARVPGVRLELAGGINRPPLHPDASAELLSRAQRLLPGVTGQTVGGGSDGNFTAGIGVPTLDGLGAVGAGAHAEGEYVEVSQIEPRAALLAALVDDLRRDAAR